MRNIVLRSLPVALLWVVGATAAVAASPEQIAARSPVPAVNTQDGVAAKGYDVVAYFIDSKPVPGSPEFTDKWQGAAYRFASAEHLAAFKRGPAKYVPQYGGYCSFAVSQGNIVDVDPRQWKIVDGKLYLNANFFAHALWKQDPPGHIRKGDSNWKIIPRKEL